MTKQEFLTALQKKLSGLPKQEIEERLTFYGEMIDDRMEDGRTEEEAVSAIGSVDVVAEQIIAEIPLAKIAKERIKPKKRLRVWEIVLLALGSPIWLSLLIAAVAVILSLYVVLWSLIASLWAVFAALVASSVGCVIAGIFWAFCENGWMGIVIVGAGLTCAGLSIFLFFGCKEATRGILLLTKKIAVDIKKCFVRKETRDE